MAGSFVENVLSGDSWMYPYQRTPMGNPYISPISCGYLWVSYPQESIENPQLDTMVVHTYVLGVHLHLSLGPCLELELLGIVKRFFRENDSWEKDRHLPKGPRDS